MIEREMNRQGSQERQEEKKILASLVSWRFDFLLFRAVSTRLSFQSQGSGERIQRKGAKAQRRMNSDSLRLRALGVFALNLSAREAEPWRDF
ncbi:hypothetical protein [Sorangium sp. So ce1024]|uniref:hypothetical protein n=1 Tax=Sorangium sp. So ce1024 TaxID=3133327 RepID=UPI003EFFB4E2